MSNENESVTRRQALVAGLAGAAGLAGVASLAALPGPSGPAGTPGPGGTPGPVRAAPGSGTGGTAPVRERMPVVFLPHGGGPWPFVDVGLGDKVELDQLATYLRSIRALPKTPPRALLVVSAHWEEPVPTVMTGERPPMFYDYYGFPPASYEITWPAPGHPEIAARVRELLGAAGFETAADAQRGFDHGTFVPLKLAYPDADVPTVQLSLRRGLDPEEHLAMGRALAPLRDEGVFIVGSGMTFHNLRGFRDARSRPVSEEFDAWLRETATLAQDERDPRLAAWASAPAARQAHPREEHLLPLMVIAGAAGADRGTIAYNGTILGLRLSAYHYG